MRNSDRSPFLEMGITMSIAMVAVMPFVGLLLFLESLTS